jgi:hypothetical protein
MAYRVPGRTQRTPLLIKHENASLPAYYRQPSYEASHKQLSYKLFALIFLYAVTSLAATLLWWKCMPILARRVHPELEAGGPDCQNPARMIKAKYGAVASENRICSEMGINILDELGGNAVDALVTTTLCSGVTNMFSYVILSTYWKYS